MSWDRSHVGIGWIPACISVYNYIQDSNFSGDIRVLDTIDHVPRPILKPNTSTGPEPKPPIPTPRQWRLP